MRLIRRIEDYFKFAQKKERPLEVLVTWSDVQGGSACEIVRAMTTQIGWSSLSHEQCSQGRDMKDVGAHVWVQDLNYGEVQARFKILSRTVYVPTWFLNFSMALQPDGTWYRESKVFFNLFDSPAGRYTFKNIIDGEGRPGVFFKEWVAARNGSPTRIPLQVLLR